MKRFLLLGLSVALAALPAVGTPVGAETEPKDPVLLTLDAPDAVIDDARLTLTGKMDSAIIARTAQSVVAAIEAAGGEASIPSYRFPYVVANLPEGFDPLMVVGVKTVSDVPRITHALDTARNTIEVSDTIPALTLGTARAPNTQVLRGTGQNIAVIDSGLDAAHAFLSNEAGASRVIAEACFTQQGDCPKASGPGASHPLPNDDSPTATATNSHGMHVAGVAAGRHSSGTNPTRGVAPDAGFIGVRIFPVNSRQGMITDLVKALEWLVIWIDDNADNPNSAIAAVNLSLGFGCPELTPTSGLEKDVYDLIEALRRRGAVTVAATGNSGSRTSIEAPACYSNTFAVTATEISNGTEVIASFANASDAVDVAAPGRSIRSSGTVHSYLEMSGTSMAAPMVSGAIALVREATPGLSGAALLGTIRTALTTAVLIDDTRPEEPASDTFTGHPAGSVSGISLLRLPEAVTLLPEADRLSEVSTAPRNVAVSTADR